MNLKKRKANKMEEIWKDIEGYEGKYKVSNLGNVKSFVRDKNGKLLVGGRSGKYRNYYSVRLCGRCFKVHRLVAVAFIPNPNNLPMVNHKDENGLNNCVENLEWCDNKYNVNYGTCQERHSQRNKELGLFVGEKNPGYGKHGKLNPAHREVLMYSLSGKLIKEFECVTYAALETGVNISDILSCCNKKVRRAGNYIWRFKENGVSEEIEPYKHPGERSVLQYSKDGHFLQKYDSIKVASEMTGISRMTIGLCCCGKIRTSGGYIWRHANGKNKENADLLDFEGFENKKRKWTKESCYEEAKKYSFRSQFQKGCGGAYIVSRKNGWLDDYTWFEEGKKVGADKKRKYDYMECFNEAKKWETLFEFRKNAPHIYEAAYRNGWVEEYTWLVRLKKCNGHWNHETCFEEAKKYLKKSDFKRNSCGAYNAARRNGWLDEYTWFIRK